jgi:hypothetical protein
MGTASFRDMCCDTYMQKMSKPCTHKPTLLLLVVQLALHFLPAGVYTCSWHAGPGSVRKGTVHRMDGRRMLHLEVHRFTPWQQKAHCLSGCRQAQCTSIDQVLFW